MDKLKEEYLQNCVNKEKGKEWYKNNWVVISTIKQIVEKQVFEDKDLMLSLCDCDRHEDVHLQGCRYLSIKDRFQKPTED